MRIPSRAAVSYPQQSIGKLQAARKQSHAICQLVPKQWKAGEQKKKEYTIGIGKTVN